LDCASEQGRVDYEKAKFHADLPAFEEAVCELQCLELCHLTKDQMLAFGLNVYSLMIRYAFIKIGICMSENDRVHFLDHVKFEVDSKTFSLQEWIDLLRGNEVSPMTKMVSFGSLDSRKDLAMSELDFRIHFALNSGAILCGSASLPFAEFNAEKVDEQLEIATQVFCSDQSNLRIEGDQVCISKAIGWYRSDFDKSDDQLFHYLSDHADAVRGAMMKKLEDSWFRIAFVDVSWSQRASNFRMYSPFAFSQKPVKGVKAFLRRFQAPKIGANEGKRLAALRKLQMVDSLPEERFDRITSMVQKEFDVAFVFLVFVDKERVWIKSTQNMLPSIELPSEAPRDLGYCPHTINNDPYQIYTITDAHADDRFADNPNATSEVNATFYAGCPLGVPSEEGEDDFVNIGTLCISDQKPRTFGEEEKAQLRRFGLLVKNELLSLKTKSKNSCPHH
jgi:hypothetical protein